MIMEGYLLDSMLYLQQALGLRTFMSSIPFNWIHSGRSRLIFRVIVDGQAYFCICLVKPACTRDVMSINHSPCSKPLGGSSYRLTLKFRSMHHDPLRYGFHIQMVQRPFNETTDVDSMSLHGRMFSAKSVL